LSPLKKEETTYFQVKKRSLRFKKKTWQESRGVNGVSDLGVQKGKRQKKVVGKEVRGTGKNRKLQGGVCLKWGGGPYFSGEK